MQSSTSTQQAAFASSAQTIATRVVFSWSAPGYTDVSLAVKSVDTEISLVTDQPDGTRVLDGYMSGTATIVLTGILTAADPSKTALWLLDPWSTSSPLSRVQLLDGSVTVTIEQGILTSIGVEWTRIFTGVLRSRRVNRKAGEVTLECQDMAYQLRNSGNVPSIAAMNPEYQAVAGYELSPLLSALWPLDYVLRVNGFYSSPAPRTGVRYFQSYHGSAWPEIVDADATVLECTASQFVAGRYVPQIASYADLAGDHTTVLYGTPISCAVGAKVFVDGLFNSLAYVTGTSYHLDVSVLADPDDETSSVTSVVRFSVFPSSAGISTRVSIGRPSLVSGDGIDGPSVTSAGWHYAAMFLEVLTSTSIRCTFRIDSTTSGPSTATVTALPDSGQATLIQANLDMRAEGVQLTSGETTPMTSTAQSFSPTAVFDTSLNMLTAVPAVDADSDAKDVITAIASAEQATIGCDEHGVMRFVNRVTRSGGTVVDSVSSLISLLDMDIEEDGTGVAKTVSAVASPLAPGPYDTVLWSASEVYEVPPWATRVIRAETDKPVVTLHHDYQVLDYVTAPTANGYNASLVPNGTSVPVTGLIVRASQAGQTSIDIHVTNPYGFAVYLCTPNDSPNPGQPSLVLVGQALIDNSGVFSTSTRGGVTVTAGDGVPMYAAPLNPWQQDSDIVQGYVNDELADLYRSRPFIRNVRAIAKPTRQLGDRATVVDPSEHSLNEVVMLIRIRNQLARGSAIQELDFRTISTPGGWILGYSGRSELGVTTRL